MSKFDISFDQKIKKGWTRGTMTKFGELRRIFRDFYILPCVKFSKGMGETVLKMQLNSMRVV